MATRSRTTFRLFLALFVALIGGLAIFPSVSAGSTPVVKNAGEKIATATLEANGVDTAPNNMATILADHTQPMETRRLSALALGEDGSTDSTILLASFANVEEADVRSAVIAGLVSSRNEKAIPVLKDVLVADEPSGVKLMALSGLNNMGTALADRAILTASQTEDFDLMMSRALLVSLQQMDESGAADAISKFSTSGNAEIRARAAIALGAHQDVRASAALVEAIQDGGVPYNVFLTAVDSLETFSGREFGQALSENGIAEEDLSRSAESANLIREQVNEWWSSQTTGQPIEPNK